MCYLPGEAGLVQHPNSGYKASGGCKYLKAHLTTTFSSYRIALRGLAHDVLHLRHSPIWRTTTSGGRSWAHPDPVPRSSRRELEEGGWLTGGCAVSKGLCRSDRWWRRRSHLGRKWVVSVTAVSQRFRACGKAVGEWKDTPLGVNGIHFVSQLLAHYPDKPWSRVDAP